MMRGETLLALRKAEVAVSHSASLLQSVSGVLEEAGLTLSDVEVFAAASGPGSFTGLRIGLATVKAFAMTMSRPCVGIPTLHAVAHAGGLSERTLALLPGGRGEVFAQLLTVGRDGDVYPLDVPIHLTPQKLLDKFIGVTHLKWVGEAAQIYTEAIKAQALAQGIVFWDESQNGHDEQSGERTWILGRSQTVLAGDVAELALLRFRSGDLETPQRLRAIYVRPSDAELNV